MASNTKQHYLVTNISIILLFFNKQFDFHCLLNLQDWIHIIDKVLYACKNYLLKLTNQSGVKSSQIIDTFWSCVVYVFAFYLLCSSCIKTFNQKLFACCLLFQILALKVVANVCYISLCFTVWIQFVHYKRKEKNESSFSCKNTKIYKSFIELFKNLVSGPRYQVQDVRMRWIAALGKRTSGILRNYLNFLS